MSEDPQSEPSEPPEFPQIVPQSLADQTRERRRTGPASAPVAKGACVVAAMAFFALFLPYGFDHPSPLGLDFEHFLMALAIFAVSVVVAVVAAWTGRS